MLGAWSGKFLLKTIGTDIIHHPMKLIPPVISGGLLI